MWSLRLRTRWAIPRRPRWWPPSKRTRRSDFLTRPGKARPQLSEWMAEQVIVRRQHRMYREVWMAAAGFAAMWVCGAANAQDAAPRQLVANLPGGARLAGADWQAQTRHVQRARQFGNPAMARARGVLQHYLQDGQKQSYVGQQTTQVIAGGLESTERVMHGGPAKERIEFIGPEKMAGEVILRIGIRFLRYIPRRGVTQTGVVSGQLFEGHVRELLKGVREGRVTLQLLGTQTVAGQSASVIELRTAEGGSRLYIDDLTGVRLKSEQLNAAGNVTQSSYFTQIDYNAVVPPAEFTAQSLPHSRREEMLPEGPSLPNVAAAQQQ